MNRNEFWSLNEDLDPENSVTQLKDRLLKLSPDEVISYQEHFDEVKMSAYIWDLWAAAYLIEGGCSDDGFIDFRYGLISCGKSAYDAAIDNPDSLINVVIKRPYEYISNENFGYVALDVYKSITGKEMPRKGREHPPEPIGEEWDFDNEVISQNKFPLLWAKFGN